MGQEEKSGKEGEALQDHVAACRAALSTPRGTLLHRAVCPVSPITSPGKSYEVEAIIIIV